MSEIDKVEQKRMPALDLISRRLLFASALILAFAFIAPIIFTKISWLVSFSSIEGQIGDTIGGIMNPFIALVGVFVTFLAFYIQLQANQQQRADFQKEFKEQQRQFQLNQFENRFYEMLRLHKENVNEISVTLSKEFHGTRGHIAHSNNVISGRQAFEYFYKELEIIFHFAKRDFKSSELKVLVNEAYAVFYHGLHPSDIEKSQFFKELSELQKTHIADHYVGLGNRLNGIFKVKSWNTELEYPLFNGYSAVIGHYYRHIFQIVKMVVNDTDNNLTYSDKRSYLRVLRAQLSNHEQSMLFLNWVSGFGGAWENEENKFFTDYRMIHNIYRELFDGEIKLIEWPDFQRNYMRIDGRENDDLFEFEFWDR